jgi:hypothetical protein
VLERAAGTPSSQPWYRTHLGGLVAAVAGLAAIVVASIMQFGGHREITEPPDARVTVPLLALAIVGVGIAFVRKEPHRAIAYGGVGLAAAAVALGWVLVAAAVGAGAVLACIVIAKFL